MAQKTLQSVCCLKYINLKYVMHIFIRHIVDNCIPRWKTVLICFYIEPSDLYVRMESLAFATTLAIG